MLSIEDKQIEQLLSDLIEMGILAVSAEKKLAQNGTISLNIYPRDSEVEQAVQDYLATIDMASVNGQLALLRYEQTFQGIDLLDQIPIFIDENVEHIYSDSEQSEAGFELGQGLSQFYSTFEPKTKDELEKELLPPEFTGGVRL